MRVTLEKNPIPEVSLTPSALEMVAANILAGLKILAIIPAFLIGIPLQFLLLKLWPLGAQWLPVYFHRYLCAIIGVKIKRTGNPSEMRPLLLVSNHASWLDITVLGSIMPLSFIAKSEVGAWPLFGLCARLQQTIFVERQKRSATDDVTAEIGARLNSGACMVLFGEGTTSDGLRILPIRSALLGAANRLPKGEGNIQPVAITYTKRYGLPLTRNEFPFISWYGDMDLAPHLLAILRGGQINIEVEFCEALPVNAQSDRKKIAVEIEATLRHVFLKTRFGEIAKPTDIATNNLAETATSAKLDA